MDPARWALYYISRVAYQKHIELNRKNLLKQQNILYKFPKEEIKTSHLFWLSLNHIETI